MANLKITHVKLLKNNACHLKHLVLAITLILIKQKNIFKTRPTEYLITQILSITQAFKLLEYISLAYQIMQWEK